MLAEGMLLDFFTSLTRVRQDSNSPFREAAIMLTGLYLNYLHNLNANKPSEISSTLPGQIKLFREHDDFFPEVVDELSEDLIECDGDAHQNLLKENPDLIEDLLQEIEDERSRWISLSCVPSQQIQFGQCRFSEGMQNLMSGTGYGLFQKQGATNSKPQEKSHHPKHLHLSPDRTHEESEQKNRGGFEARPGSLFLAYPRSIQETLIEYRSKVKKLFKDTGLTHTHLCQMTREKLILFLEMPDAVINALKQKNILLKDLVAIDDIKLQLLRDNIPRTAELMALNIRLDQLAQLALDDLKTVLAEGSTPERDDLECTLISSTYGKVFP